MELYVVCTTCKSFFFHFLMFSSFITFFFFFFFFFSPFCLFQNQTHSTLYCVVSVSNWTSGSLKVPLYNIDLTMSSVWRCLSWKDFVIQILFSLWGQWLHLNVSALWQSFSHGLYWTLFLTLRNMSVLILVCCAMCHKILIWADCCRILLFHRFSGSLFRLLQRSTAKLDWRRRVHMALDIVSTWKRCYGQDQSLSMILSKDIWFLWCWSLWRNSGMFAFFPSLCLFWY